MTETITLNIPTWLAGILAALLLWQAVEAVRAIRRAWQRFKRFCRELPGRILLRLLPKAEPEPAGGRLSKSMYRAPRTTRLKNDDTWLAHIRRSGEAVRIDNRPVKEEEPGSSEPVPDDAIPF